MATAGAVPLLQRVLLELLRPAGYGVSNQAGERAYVADGGVPEYTWTLVAGELPPGLELTESPGRITGTPTTVGTFTLTVRVTDSRGGFAERTFSTTIS